MMGGQNILCPHLSKSWGDISPRPTHKLGPCNWLSC